MSEKDRARYEQAEKDYLSYWATIETAEKKGHAEGETQKAIEIARNMKEEGLDPAFISKMTGLPPEEIERLE